MSLLTVRNLRVAFGATPAVRGISFEVPEHATVALVGESGSGKSVTALSILGLLPETATRQGEICFGGKNLLQASSRELRALRGAEISMIFQEPMSSLNPVFSVGFQVGEALRAHLGVSRREARARCIALLEEVGLARPGEKIGAYPFQLSGGEQQRVMIAMAIACEPKLLIADEPTSALDVTVQKQILDLIAELQRRRRMAVLFITHDLALVTRIAARVIVMRQGEIREQGSVAEVFGAPRDDYTRALLACRPPLDRRPARLPMVDSFVPSKEERKRGLRGDEAIVLEARGLAKRFDRVEAVKGASFKLARGKTLGLVGESGSGKTTLGLLVARLHQASGGSVLLHGHDTVPPRAFKRSIQIVFQNPYASLNPRFSVGQVLTEPMRIHGIGRDAAEQRSRAEELLAKVGLPAGALFKYPHEFSGGQRQRIAIARALALGPELLICDEAVSALDVSIQAQLLNLLQDLQDEYGMSYLFISHDLAVVKYMADEVMVMKDGEIVEMAGSDEIYADPKHPYTRTLLASIPR
ncbi:MAG: ABC transporter ATP-binding protein [Burkholderiales bacterium]